MIDRRFTFRTADTADMLDAPPMLAPGPHVTGTGSAAVRLKQLRAAFVARSQQVNMAHNRYKCLSKHNDVSSTSSWSLLCADSAFRCTQSSHSWQLPPASSCFQCLLKHFDASAHV